jgi:hypothetical protein
MTLPGPEGLSLDMSTMIAYLGELHARQLSEVNIEAAKWRAAAVRAGAELADVRARVAALERTHATTHDLSDDMIGSIE